MWDLIVSVPDHCLSFHFDSKQLVCFLSLKPNDGFWPNFVHCIIGIGNIFDFGDLDIIFKVTAL